MQSTKMRIRLFDEQGKLSSDRLVEQLTEFNLGPKEKHSGPLSLELNLRDKTDATKAVEYLQKLALDLPLEAKNKPLKTPKVLDNMLKDKEPLLELKTTLLANATTQEAFIEKLREYNFVFVHSQTLDDLNTTALEKSGQPVFTLRERDKDWQFMVRLVKQAVDPANDKYDARLVFGIKFVGKRFDSIKVYWWGEFEQSVSMMWADKKKINFKKKEKIQRFPEWMDILDRKKWRKEQRALANNPELKPSKFYEKHLPHVVLA